MMKTKASMQSFTTLFFLCSLVLYQQHSVAIDTLTTSESMKDGDTISSAREIFEMGFFSPANSTNRYVGIWYKNVSVFTVVWVANRQVPLASKSGLLKLIHPTGTLILVDGTDTNNTVWSSSEKLARISRNPIVQLLDSGNLVVRDENDINPENFYWQSFDYPTDTLLPGMKLGKNFETGLETYLSSWKSRNDPSPGEYTYHCDPTGYPQLLIRKHSIETFRLGSWNGIGFSGLPTRIPNTVLFTSRLVIDEKEVYYSFDLINKLNFSKLTLTPDGIAQRWSWVREAQVWRVFFSAPTEHCDTYSLCGAYSTCNLVCQCLDKFVPQNQSEWDVNDWSSGCVRSQSLDCGEGDGFRKYSGLKLPDTRSSWHNTSMSMTLADCETACLNNCSCMAYSILDIRKGSGCLLWYGDLIDMKDVAAGSQDIYVRMASSESDLKVPKSSGSNDKKGIIIKVTLPLVIGIAFLVLGLIVHAWRKKHSSQLKAEGIQGNINQTQKGDLELQFIALPTIANATKNFSSSYKLGEGGFGPVYKGVLEDGQEIAVKRLSKTSTQGLEEFKNEVIFIAKLQHRNLVKILGYCIENGEVMLIYEYMANKSLDSFIFDERRRTLLDWPKRFQIVNGIARGLLYLHQDSRLRIIHRDLKAGNILLDSDMNPKISDFGLARKFGGNEMGENTRTVVGTYGYMSPEYAVHGLFSVKSDVFSFGVLVLEIVSGKKNRGFFNQEHGDNLLGHAWRLYKEERSLEIVDVALHESCCVSEAERLIQVGLLCVQQSPGDRPSMSSVVLMLGGERSLPQPKQPGFFTEDNILQAEISSSTGARFSRNEITITLVDGR